MSVSCCCVSAAPPTPPAASQGAAGAPPAPSRGNQGAGRGTGAADGARAGVQMVDPSSVKDSASTNGLVPRAREVLEDAHRYGLKLISGVRQGNISGTNTPSDHNHGKAIDVSNGSRPTPEMQAFADWIRGKPGVKYVIYDNRIASPTDNWAWRPYTPKGSSNPTTRHEDHVHVSFN